MPDRAQMKVALAALVFFTAVITGFGAEPARKILPGHVVPATTRLTPIGQLPATNELHLAIGVPLRDPAGLDKFLAEVYAPASPNYRKFLTPEEFAARFSVTEGDYAVVKNFARTNGFVITHAHGNRLLLDVTAKAADVERAFHLKLNKFKHPTENREFFAPDVEPTVEADLPIVDIQGLSDCYKPHPKLHKMDSNNTATPKNGSGSVGSYLGDDFRNAYAPGVTLTGAGQQVGLFQLDGYYPSDIAAYAQQAGGGRTNIQVLPVPVGSTNWNIGVNGGNGEVSLDIEMAMAMAPGLSKILVFEGPSSAWPNDVLNAMAASNTVKNLSSSWGWSGGPQASTDNIFKTMAAQGQSFFNASGDSDAFTIGAGSVNGVDNPSNTGTPASSPYITQVGGTTLTMNGTGASFASETVWNWGLDQGKYVGSSGGVSSYYSLPSWQSNLNVATNLGSTTQRNIPDVALTGDNVFVDYNNGSTGAFGGTSCAAPLWAGFMALVNQQFASNSGNATNSVGFINPVIYVIGKGENPNFDYASCFHDTTAGNNYWPSSPTSYPAVAGYDLCTGWGTPNGSGFINALAFFDYLTISPSATTTASGSPGGPFSPSSQVFTLTNAGASALNWFITSTSSWLTVSSTSGTLAANSQTSVTVSINSAANSLGSGTYFSTVVFSNQTSGVSQNRQFNLVVSDPLVLLTTNGFTASGAAGGPFYPGSQAVTFTNLGATSLNWSLLNAPSWLTISSGSGSLNGHSSVSVAVSTNSATANLANGTYNATLVLSNQSTHLTHGLVFAALVGQNMVQNGGFETGDFTAWTLSGNFGSFAVTSSSAYVHSGTYGLQATANGLGYITQNLSTAPGQTYQLSFWFFVSGTRANQQFQANWNGSTVYNTTAPPTSWTNQKLIVTATSTNTQLQFGLNSASSHSLALGIDDISVTPVNLPVITQQPVSQTNLAGSNVTFIAGVTGSTPLAFQWRTNGVNLVNGGNFSGANTNVLTLTAITPGNSGNYTLVVTNAYGSVTSSVATLTVTLPAAIASSSLTNRSGQCGQNTNTFAITTSGTAPLAIQWSLNGMPFPGATSTSFSLTNLSVSTANVSVTVTNLYGSAASNVTLTVIDSLPPVISLASTNPFYVELGGTYVEPGAAAFDLCAGVVPVVTNGTVNTSVVSTNTVTYAANDGNGNTNTAVRTVIVRDTTPPVISWSFTNQTVGLNSNCIALMPDVTGTNFILAADLSGSVTVTQSPTNNATLQFGTNTVVLTVADASGNKSYSTNRVIVFDQTPPVFVSQPQSQTNFAGTTANFSVAASACTTLSFQWFFNSTPLTAQTNMSLALSNLTAAVSGNYFAVATAAGGSSTSVVATLTVNLNPASVVLDSWSNPDGFKDSLNFTVAVTPTNATGTIQFLTNGTAFDLEPLVTGAATSTNLSTLPRGTNFITAIYSGDAADLPATNTLAQIVTNHPPQVAPAFYTLVAGLDLTIAVAALATNWSDADGDLLSVAFINVSTNGVTVTNALPDLFYSNPNYVSDQFVCVISDGFGGTNFQAVNITVVPQTNATPAISSVAAPPPGGIVLQLTGAYGSTYVLESADDLTVGDWQPVATNTLGLTGVWQFTDFGVTNNPVRFYRLKLVQ